MSGSVDTYVEEGQHVKVSTVPTLVVASRSSLGFDASTGQVAGSDTQFETSPHWAPLDSLHINSMASESGT